MKRTMTVLSLVLTLAIAVFAQAASAQETKREHFGKKQLNALIASARTPDEHQRIAHFYAANAQDYRAQAREHEAMIAAYKANTSLSNNKNQASTIGHCEYFVHALNDLAAKSDELAKLHQDMAAEALKK